MEVQYPTPLCRPFQREEDSLLLLGVGGVWLPHRLLLTSSWLKGREVLLTSIYLPSTDTEGRKDLLSPGGSETPGFPVSLLWHHSSRWLGHMAVAEFHNITSSHLFFLSFLFKKKFWHIHKSGEKHIMNSIYPFFKLNNCILPVYFHQSPLNFLPFAYIFYNKPQILFYLVIHISHRIKKHNLNSIITLSKMNNKSLISFYINFYSNFHACAKKFFAVGFLNCTSNLKNKQTHKQINNK